MVLLPRTLPDRSDLIRPPGRGPRSVPTSLGRLERTLAARRREAHPMKVARGLWILIEFAGLPLLAHIVAPMELIPDVFSTGSWGTSGK